MTLLEVMFVTGLLGLFMLMVSRALVMGFRAHKKTMERTAAYRQGSVAMSRMLRELTVCYQWVTPAIGSGVVQPTAPGAFSWNRTTKDTGSLLAYGSIKNVQYWRDVNQSELRALDPSLPAGYRVVARDVTDFRIEVQATEIKVTLDTKNNGVPLVIVGRPQQM